MNRPLLITIGIVVIGLVVSIWAYLLLYGTPSEPREVFTNFGFLAPIQENTDQEAVAESGNEQSDVSLLALDGKLEQLTTRAVAGHTFVLTDDSILIRYAEMGTGHIYEINVTKAEETRISITTIPETAKAVFSPHGERVALIRYTESGELVTVGTIDLSSMELADLSTLPSGAQNIAFRNDNTVYYTLQTNAYTIGNSYEILANASAEVFRIPTPDILMHWDGLSNIHHAVTRSAPQLQSALYRFENGTFFPLGRAGNGLIGFANTEIAVATKIEDGAYVSYSLGNGGERVQNGVLIPEKCTFDVLMPTEAWCGIPNAAVDDSFIERWYKGEERSADSLWFVNLDKQTSRRVLDIAKAANRNIDVLDIKADVTGSYLSFINKIDQSLWLYKIN